MVDGQHRQNGQCTNTKLFLPHVQRTLAPLTRRVFWIVCTGSQITIAPLMSSITRVSCIPIFNEPSRFTLHPLNFITVVFLARDPDSGSTILHKRVNQRKVSSLLKLLWPALQVATQKRKLGDSLVCHGCDMFDHSVITESYSQVLSVHDLLQYLSYSLKVLGHGSVIQIPFLTAQSTQIKSVISVPIKDFIHHYPRALFNDIPGSGRIFTTYPGRGAV